MFNSRVLLAALLALGAPAPIDSTNRLGARSGYSINGLLADPVGPFTRRSRGHGGKHRAKSKFSKANAALRRQRNKYTPHQGKQEIARRLRTKTPSIPRQLWSDVITVIRHPKTEGYVQGPTRKDVARQARRFGVKSVNPVLGVVYG